MENSTIKGNTKLSDVTPSKKCSQFQKYRKNFEAKRRIRAGWQ